MGISSRICRAKDSNHAKEMQIWWLSHAWEKMFIFFFFGRDECYADDYRNTSIHNSSKLLACRNFQYDKSVFQSTITDEVSGKQFGDTVRFIGIDIITFDMMSMSQDKFAFIDLVVMKFMSQDKFTVIFVVIIWCQSIWLNQKLFHTFFIFNIALTFECTGKLPAPFSKD